jgi:hydrogenase expression/formation protein HypC
MSYDAVKAAEPVCQMTDGCITCGDVAVPLTVVELIGLDARCRDDQGCFETVALDFVTAEPGDRVLVHAGVALERLHPVESADPTESREP